MGDRKRPRLLHPPSDLTSSWRPSLFSGSAPEAGCWSMELSESGSTSVTAAALGSDTSLQEENSGRKDKSEDYFHEKNPHIDHNYTINYNKHIGNLQSKP